MFSATKILALVLAFTLGFAVGAGALVGGVAIVLSNFTIRSLEDNNIMEIPDESFIGEDPEVDILDLTAIELFEEYKNLQSFGDELTLNKIQERYALIFHDRLNELLTEDTRNMPLKKLLSQDGVHVILESVYIGNIEKYECKVDTAEGSVAAKPTDEGSYWVTQEGKKVSGIEDMIADWSLADFVDGKINTNDIFNDLTIGEVLGYEEVNGVWYDDDGNKATGPIAAFAGSTLHSIDTDMNNKLIGELLGYEKHEGVWRKVNEDGTKGDRVTGVMSSLADCKINGVDEFIDSEPLGKLLGYEQREDGWYKINDDGSTGEKVTGAMAVFADSGVNDIDSKIETTQVGSLLGYEYNKEEKQWYKTDENDKTKKVPIDGFMSKISDKNINQMDSVFETLVIGDIVKEEDRTGIFSIIGPDTPIDKIGSEVNDSIMGSPLQFFINEGLIDFSEVSGLLDPICQSSSVNYYVYILHVDECEEGEEGYENFKEFEKLKSYYEFETVRNADGEVTGKVPLWIETVDADGNKVYKVPAWRTKELNKSFSYIILFMQGFAIPESTTPINAPSADNSNN